MSRIAGCAYLLLRDYTSFNTALLQPVFKTAITQSIETEDFKLYRLDYCFGNELSYKITVSVITEDQKSGFVTYVCKKTYMIKHGRCDVRTPYRDISGGPVNVVVMDVEKPADFGPVHVLLSGDGRHGQSNRFTLAASVPYTSTDRHVRHGGATVTN